MATAKQIIDKALSYEGVKEDRNGYVIFNKRYWGRDIDAAWCAAFVWCVFQDCNASELFFDGKKCAYVPTIADWGIAKGLTVPKSQGRYGDLVTFDWDHNGNSDHIGFIISKNVDGSYKTIEGNTSLTNQANGGQVMIRTRYQSSISYIIRPKYEESPSTSPKPVTPVASSTTSVIETGKQHAINFCGYANKAKVLQHALNLDYGSKLVEDGIFGDGSKRALGNHYVQRGETQYMVTALEILLMMNDCNPNGVECPGKFGTGLESTVKKFQTKKGLVADGIAGRNTFLELIK